MCTIPLDHIKQKVHFLSIWAGRCLYAIDMCLLGEYKSYTMNAP